MRIDSTIFSEIPISNKVLLLSLTLRAKVEMQAKAAATRFSLDYK